MSPKSMLHVRTASAGKTANGAAAIKSPHHDRKSEANRATPTSGKTSKHNQILALLRRKQGASLAELQAASYWQPHSVRGFLSGTIKKRLKFKLTSSVTQDGVRRYSIPVR